jgi:phosphoribosylformimino-5-aminoimidazole carboxamide ribonucleotide (ProFAR) isomerase
LSTARALAVAEFLKQSGLPERQIGVSGFGGHQPIATNSTPEDRRRNRRVEIFVLPPEAPIVGWTETTTRIAADLALAAQDAGAGTVIYTDVATDGTLEGPNYAALQNLLEILDCNLIASGGVASGEDLERLASMQGLYGAIIGKALYEGKITPPFASYK